MTKILLARRRFLFVAPAIVAASSLMPCHGLARDWLMTGEEAMAEAIAAFNREVRALEAELNATACKHKRIIIGSLFPEPRGWFGRVKPPLRKSSPLDLGSAAEEDIHPSYLAPKES